MAYEKRVLISQIDNGNFLDKTITIGGWIRSVRNSKKFSFIVINDGSSQESLQIVADATIESYDVVKSLLTGASVLITGKIVSSGGHGQKFEMHASQVKLIGEANEEYPLQKKKTSLEFLRENAHLRPRTNTFGAVFRVRSTLAFATHEFFQNRGLYYINTPIITASDCEGAGELFKVTTLDFEKLPKNDKNKVNFEQDYFGKEANLTVSGQLEAECFALSMGGVYTFGPTFRAENSNTQRHLSEFWMIEPELAFADLEDVADLASDYLKYLIESAMEKCPQELEFLQNTYKNDLIETLNHVKSSDFIKVSYTEAIDILEKSGKKFEFSPKWGVDLQTEHERYLTEEHYKLPVIVTDYPKDIKAFYMKLNDDGKTVRAMDILVPGVGEIIGGSQRECNLGKLKNRMEEMNINPQDIWWYLDLRRFGSVPHAGFGLGFERAVMYITGMSNIRDVIPFYRTPKNVDF